MCQHRSLDSLAAQRLPDSTKYLGVFDQQTLNLLFGLPGGLIFCSEDLCHHFTPCSRPTKTSILAAKNIPKPHRWRYPPASHSTVAAHHLSGKTPLFTLLCTEKNIQHAQKHSVKAPPLPKPSNFSTSFSFCRSLPTLLILTPIPGEASHPKKTPSRPGLRSLNLLHVEPPPSCVATPLVK